jgi:hypothetical protein
MRLDENEKGFGGMRNLQSVEFILDIGSRRDRTIEFDQRLSEIVGDLDVLEPIKRRDRELRSIDL